MYFFFQAEDGIRDDLVTGVQTCALPIWALANAREFGGRHYDGYHTFMALAPAFDMAQHLPDAQKPLPVLKVLYRNSTHIQAQGGRKAEVLHPVKPVPVPEGKVAGEVLRDLTR